jgi:Family of unknown function (DUF6065)
MQQLECFATTNRPPDIVPGRPQRAWMDAFDDKHAYRCLPLTMANSTGWEILCPMAFHLEWNGGTHQQDITITTHTPHPDLHHFVTSHFSHGVVTFHPGYLFRTPPGWSMWAMGPPNHVKDGIQPLAGLVETDWLPFPFTMNWIFTRPGKVSFAKNEPFCFITLAQDRVLDEVNVISRPLESDPDLRAQYDAWVKYRSEFNTRIFRGDEETIKTAWQRFYFKGEVPDNVGQAPAEHVNKRRLKSLRSGR